MKSIRMILLIFILISSLFLTGLSNNALIPPPDMKEYSTLIEKRMEENIKTEEILSGWRNGVKEDFDAELVSLQANIIPRMISKTTDGKVLFFGTLIMTGYCTKNGLQIRIISESTHAWLFFDGKTVEKVVEVDRKPLKVIDGWYGTPI